MNKLNILLADDDTDDCLFFQQALSALAEPVNFSAVYDGEQLMQLLMHETVQLPDILFLDLNMPRKNGFECLTEIKKQERLKGLPVVIFSTSGAHEHMSILFKTGANVYIRKPDNLAQLVQVIQHAFPMATEKLFSNGRLKYILNA
ncbi:MAG: response regulator [Ferruginibacter sp.]